MAEKLGSAILELRTDNKGFSKGIKDAENLANKFGKTLSKNQLIAIGLGTAVAGAMAVVVKAGLNAAIEFESSFAGIRKTVNATEAEFAALEKGMRDLSKTIPVNVNELNAIGEAAGQLGIKTENILGFTEVMAKLGVATNLSSDQAATALARLANITQLPQDQFDRLGSTIVELGNNFATTEAEIVEMGLRLAGAGAQIGLTEAQILGFGAALSSVGIEAEAGGSAFSKLFIQIASAVETGNADLVLFANAAGQTAEEFRKSFEEDAAGAINEFISGLADLKESGGSIIAVLEELGITEVRIRDAILRAAGAGDLLTKSLKTGTRAFEENVALQNEAEQRFKTTEKRIELLKNKIDDLTLSIGQVFLPAFNKVIDALIVFVDTVSGANNSVEKFREEQGLLASSLDATALKITLAAQKNNNELKPAVQGMTSATMSLAKEQKNLGKSFSDNIPIIGDAIDKLLEWTALSPQAIQATRDIAKKAKEEAEALRNEAILLNAEASFGSVAFAEYGEKLLETAGGLREVKKEAGGGGGGGGGGGFKPLKEGADKAKDAADALKDEIANLLAEIEKVGKTPAEIVKIEGALKGVTAKSKELGEEWERLSLIKLGKEAIESLKNATQELKRQQLEIIATADELITFKVRLEEVRLAEAGLAIGSEEARAALAAYRLELEKLDFVTEIDKMLKGGKLFDPFTRGFLKFQDQIVKFSEKAKDELSSLDEFIGNVASNISDTIANMLTAAFTGNFDDIKRSWKDMLKNMLNIFAQFAAAIITNPIRIALDATLGGGGGGMNLGAGLGGLLGGIGESFRSLGSLVLGEFAGFAGFAGTLSAALPAIGVIAAAAFTAVSVIGELMKKTPRLDIDFDSVKTEIGRRAAVISEILDPKFFADSIAQISVKRGGVGLGAGGDSAIKKLIQERLEQTIEGIQAIISTLPTEIFKQLNETLLSAELDIDTVIGGERLLEFDAKGKKIAEKFQAFIEGELPAKLFAAIRESFFDPAFQALGVSADATQNMIDQFLSDLESAGSREARGQVGQAFLEDFATFVDAFNVLSGNAGDAIGAALNQINALSTTIGFDAVPSIAELDRQLAEFVRTADVDGVKAILELRNAISQLKAEILASISSIIGNIQSLNATIAAFGGASVDVTGFLNQAVGSIMDMLSQPGLSIGEQEALLGDLMGFANQLLAEEQAAFNAAQEEQTKAAEAQQAAIQNTINSLNAEKQRIEAAHNARIDALNEELRIVQDLESLINGIRQNIQDLLFAPGGPESVFERISRAQAEVSKLFAELQGAGPEEQAEIGARLQDMLNELNALRQEGFQAPSPESDALFRAIVGGLEMLEGLIEPARSSEDIQASIESLTAQNQAVLESIDAQIQSSQTRIAQISEQTSRNTFKMSEELQSLFEYIRGEQIRILEERLSQLGEVADVGLADIAGIEQDQLVVLRSIADALGAVPSMANGGFVPPGQNTLAMLHGGMSGEDVIPRARGGARGNVSVSLTLPPISFAPGQVVNVDMFMRELKTKLHDRRISDEIVKIVRGRT